jgi:hypothetical protein
VAFTSLDLFDLDDEITVDAEFSLPVALPFFF